MAEEIGVLRVDLSLDSADFVKSTQQVDSKLRALNSEFKASKSGVENFEKSVEGLRAKQDFLTKTLELQKTKVSTLKAEYDKIAQSQGANSVAAEKMLVKYNNAVAALKKTEAQIDKTNKAIKDQGGQWQKAESFADKYKGKLEATSKSLSSFGDKTTEVGRNLSVGLTTPLVAAGTALGMIAAQFENAQVNIQNSLGATSEEAGKLAEIAENVWADGFGENMESVSDALIRVKQNMKGINNDAELEKVTRDALILSKTFDSDVNEVTRAGQNVMKSFGVTSTEAFDTFAKAAQNGANFSNEMFDNISEYAPLAAKAGYSFAEYMKIVANASSAGVYNLDYVNDLLKETQIRLKDGSSTTSDAMKLMSKETNELWKSYLKGDKTVADVMPKIVSELEGMKDQTKANQIAVALMGTKFEDMEADAVYSIFGVKEAIGDTTGAMDKMAKAQEQTFNQRWQSLLRQAQQRLEPVGKEILDIAEDWLPKLADGLERAVGWFSDLSEEGQGLIVKLAGIAAAAGPLMMGGGMFASGASNVLKLGSSLADTAKKGGLLAGALGAFTGPVGIGALVVGSIGAITWGIKELADQANVTTEEMIKMQEEAFNNSVDAYEDAKAVNDLAIEYDNLRDKSKLSTVELLEFVDVQKQIENTSSTSKLEALRDRQAELQKKSGLTNEELAKMIQLDGQLQESVEGVELAFDAKGNAVVKYTTKLQEATQAEFEYQKSQLAETMAKGLDQYAEAQEKINTIISERYVANQEQLRLNEEIKNKSDEIRKIEQERKTISDELKALDEQRAGLSAQEIIELESKISAKEYELQVADKELLTEEEKYRRLEAEHAKQKEIYQTKTEEQTLLESQIAQQEYHYEQLLNTLAAEVGIKAEQGKQIDQMRTLLNTNKETIASLEAKKKTAEGLTKEEQEQLTKLYAQNKQIQANIGKAEEWNAILAYDITKRLIVNDNGKISVINKELAKTIYKQLVVTEVGSTSNGHGRRLKYQGDKSFEGGSAIVGELGVERAVLPSGKRIDLGVNGIEMVNLPKGTRIYNHLETAKMDGLLPANANTTVFKDFNLENKLKNIRWFAEGGIVDSPTIFGRVGSTLLGAGEAGKEAIAPIDKLLGYVRTAVRDEIGSGGNDTPDINVTVQNVYNNKVIDEVFYPRINKKLATDTKQYNYMRGGRIK